MAQPAPGEVSTPAHHPVHLSDTTINTSPSTHDTSTPDPLQPYRGGSQQASSHELTDKAVPPGSGTSLPSPLLPDLMITASHDSTGTADCKNAAPTSDAAHIHKLPSGLEETIAPGATAWITPDNSQTSDSAHVHDGYDNVRDYLDKTMRNADRDGGPYAVEQALRSLEKGLGSDHKLAYRFFQKPSSGQEFVSATLDDHVNSTVELFRNNEVKRPSPEKYATLFAGDRLDDKQFAEMTNYMRDLYQSGQYKQVSSFLGHLNKNLQANDRDKGCYAAARWNNDRTAVDFTLGADGPDVGQQRRIMSSLDFNQPSGTERMTSKFSPEATLSQDSDMQIFAEKFAEKAGDRDHIDATMGGILNDAFKRANGSAEVLKAFCRNVNLNLQEQKINDKLLTYDGSIREFEYGPP